MELEGKTALVTGGARRIGAAICVGLAEQGVRVAIHCHESEAEAQEVAQRCPGSIVVQADLADHGASAPLLDAVEERFGPLDFLVNNASIYKAIDPAEIDEDAWDHALDVNLKAPFFLARDAGLRMRNGNGGVIVNLTDAMVDRPYPSYLPYFAAKAGLEAVTAGLARVLAPRVRVNAIAPGPVLLPDAADEEYARVVREATPLERVGGTNAIVSTVLFLLRNDFVTGASVRVDGGRSLR